MFFLVCNFTLSPTSCSKLPPPSLLPLLPTMSTFCLYSMDFLSSVISVPVLSSLLPSAHAFLSLVCVLASLLSSFSWDAFPGSHSFNPFTTSSYFSPLLSSCLTVPLCLALFPLHSLSPYTPFSCFPLTSSHIAASYLLWARKRASSGLLLSNFSLQY